MRLDLLSHCLPALLAVCTLGIAYLEPSVEPLQQTRQRNRGLQCSTCAGGMANLEGGELASESEAALVHPSSEAEASAAGQRWPAGGTRLSEGGLASGIESLCGRAGPGGEAKGIALGQMYCDA